MTGYSIPSFFPADCNEWIKERLEAGVEDAETLSDDIRALLNPALYSAWEPLHKQAQNNDAFERLFIMASVYKSHFAEVHDPDIVIERYRKIESLSEKLAKMLSGDDYMDRNIKDSVFNIIKDTTRSASPLSSAGEVSKFFTKENPYPFNKGLPKNSVMLFGLAETAREKASEVRFFKDELLAARYRAKTALRTTGIKYMASITTDKALFRKPCWGAVATIISALHEEHDAISGNDVSKIWQESQKGKSKKEDYA